MERSKLLYRIGQLISENIEKLAVFEALDVGKPLKQARADALAMVRYMEFYAGAADKVHGSTIPYLYGYTVYSLRELHGVMGHIVPWNYPMQIIGSSVGGTLAMGNAVVLKPAEEACLKALAFADLARQAGLPEAALSVVPGLEAEAGVALSAHPGVHHVSFTGSVNTGRLVQTAATQNVRPVTLELGRKSPQLVLDDADIDPALPFLVNAGIQNVGQTCSASSRIVVQKGIDNQVVSRIAERYAGLQVAPAMDDCDVGPLISVRQKQIVEGFLGKGADLEVAARTKLSDDLPAGGNFLAPTLFAGVSADHGLAQDEIFWPGSGDHSV